MNFPWKRACKHTEIMSGWPADVSFTDVCVTCHGDEASDEAEVGQVVGIDGGCWVDLQTVVALAGVFKQTVHGVQHLVRQEEEPLPAHTHTHTSG